MITGLFGRGTLTSNLRAGLDELSATQKTIAQRVADSAAQSANSDFAEQLGAHMASKDEEIQRNMASLADTELRFEAAAKLLQKSYADFRTAIANRG